MTAARRRLFAVALVAGLTTLVARDTGRAQPAGRDDVLVLKNVMVAMRDGVRLATDIHRPAKNGVPLEGKFPVILERTPYNKEGSQGWAQTFVPRGYVAVAQDVRGRYASEGRWRPARADG
jgi:predicted acyl esterase